MYTGSEDVFTFVSVLFFLFLLQNCINQVDEDGDTPLMAAVILKKHHLVEFLSDYNVDFKTRNSAGNEHKHVHQSFKFNSMPDRFFFSRKECLALGS